MSSFWRRQLIIVVGAIAVASSLAGCANWNLRGDGFDTERFPEMPLRETDNQKPKKDVWGFSTKAREIEDRLGVE